MGRVGGVRESQDAPQALRISNGELLRRVEEGRALLGSHRASGEKQEE